LFPEFLRTGLAALHAANPAKSGLTNDDLIFNGFEAFGIFFVYWYLFRVK